MRRIILPALLLLALLSACAPDPRKQAQAYAIESEAAQAAADAEQARQQSADLHQAEMERLTLEQQNREAAQAEWQAASRRIIMWGGYALLIAVCVVILAAAWTIRSTMLGIGQIAVRAAEVRANQIALDVRTRQYPLFIQHVHGTRYALVNPNTDSVRMLDVSNEPDRQMIAAMGATQLTGVLADAAAHSTDPAGVAMIRPTVISAKEPDLLVGDLHATN